MSNAKMFKALNDQIKYEFYSSYMYLSMSAYLAEMGLPGCSHWMRMQSNEELLHANKFFDFIVSRGGRVTLQSIETPPNSWKTPLDIFQAGLKHEQLVTSRINALMDLALSSKDYATHTFLQWFVSEQVEEEETFTDLINKFKLIKGEGQGLLLLDRDLGLRQPTALAHGAAG